MSANSNPFKIIKTRATSVLYEELMSTINKTNELFGINIKKNNEFSGGRVQRIFKRIQRRSS